MVKKEDAVRYLEDVPVEKAFWVNNGPVLKNLYELGDALQNMSDETYMHHANKEKNDFSKWVDEVVGDNRLAKDLLSARNKESAFNKVSKRAEALGRKVG